LPCCLGFSLRNSKGAAQQGSRATGEKTGEANVNIQIRIPSLMSQAREAKYKITNLGHNLCYLS